jgi:hypothetical protein
LGDVILNFAVRILRHSQFSGYIFLGVVAQFPVLLYDVARHFFPKEKALPLGIKEKWPAA